MLAVSLSIGMALMIASQLVSWIYLTKSAGISIYKAIFHVALFYFSWAAVKMMLLGDGLDLGWITFGCLLIAAYNKQKKLAIVANLLLLLNFGIALYFILTYDPWTLAKLIKGVDVDDDSERVLGGVWGYTFELYILSSILLWTYSLYRLKNEQVHPDNGPYSTLPTTSDTEPTDR